MSQQFGTVARPHIDKGLIGFDVETGNRATRPELLRLQKRGTNDTAMMNPCSSQPDHLIGL